MIVVVSGSQPRCRYCNEPLKKWNPFVAPEQQAHVECAAHAAADRCIAVMQRMLRDSG
jgi:hypothetical protein